MGGQIKLFDAFIELALDEYSDGETPVDQCLEMLARDCCDYYFKKEALSHGIPESVVDGKTSLKDHFSQEYIDWKCDKRGES